MKNNIYAFEALDIDGQKISLAKYAGRVLLIVNVASECGFTPQYKGLQNLYENYKGRGLSVLAFPSNDFAAQEPDSNTTIKNLCEQKYNVSFDLFGKVSVIGPDKSPIFLFLNSFGLGHLSTNGLKSKIFGVVKWVLYRIKGKTTPLHNEAQWNFHKYLVGRDGVPVGSFLSEVEPESEALKQKLEEELQK